MKPINFIKMTLTVIILLVASACTNLTPAPTSTPTPAPTSTPPPTPTVDTSNLLPPEPQAVTFTSVDGTELQGYYYPANTFPAPLVVLMHWAGGDKADWNEIAVWLQNRGLKNPFTNPGVASRSRWWDPSWFPKIPADKSYAVLTFSFRDCIPYGCTESHISGWMQDALAALKFSRNLEGIDPNRIVAIGSSIGADGAADSCILLNDEFPGSCKGSLSLSPGNYLGVNYAKVIQQMGSANPPTAAWCIADPSEYFNCQAAIRSGNSAFKSFSIEFGGHGTDLLRPNLDPLPMQLIVDFLNDTLK